MIHTMIYYGNFGLNHHLLTPETTTRINSSGRETSIKPRSRKVDGIAFGYMEEPDAFYVVVVENFVLMRPVKIIEELHVDGKSFGPSASLFGDVSARRLLDDIVAANPSQRNELACFYNRISSVDIEER